MDAPLPDREAERLAALHDHCILDTAPEQEFDDLVRLAAHICGVPIAAVSLIDEHRQWFKAITGLDVTETPREAAFCAHTILQSGTMIVSDAQADPRFADNPLVTGEPHIRFYAGVPLVTEEGHSLGSLCVIDKTPRQLSSEQQETLQLLARQVSSQLRAARRVAERERLLVEKERLTADLLRLAAIVETCEDAIYSVTTEECITSWNRGAEELFGYTSAEVMGRNVSLLTPPDRRREMTEMLTAIHRAERVLPLETVHLTKASVPLDMSLRVSPISDADGSVVGASLIGRNITEWKRAASALETEREFTLALLENLQEGIVACDANGKLMLFNRATREFHGLPDQSMPPDPWTEHSDLFEADGVTPMQTENIPLYRAFHGEVVCEAEMVIAPMSGPARTLIASGRPIHSASGEKLGAVVAMHDVTDRRQSEQELSRMAAIVESAKEAILGATLDGTIVSWNSGAEKLYGFTESEIIGQHISCLAQAGDSGPVSAVVSRLRRGETIEPLEVLRRHRSGNEFYAALSFSPIRDGAGEMIGISCMARDITARKQVEEALARTYAALAESGARLAEAQRIAQIGSWEYDVAGDKLTWSDELFRLFGIDPAVGEPSYTDAMALYHPEDAPLLNALVFRATQEGIGYTLDLRGASLPHSDERQKWFHTVGTAVADDSGQVVRLMGTVADITDRKQSEDALRRSEAALRAVLESAPIILYAADADGTVTLSEGTGLTALGLKPGEAVGRSVFEFSGGDPELQANSRRALAGEALSYDAHFQGLSLHTELRPLMGADNSPSGLIGVCFDVTERVASEERFRVLFERSSDAHILAGEAGIIDCNDAAVALMRCTDKSQMMSLHPAVFSSEFQPDGRQSLVKGMEMDSLARERGSHSFEWTHRRMDGEEVAVEVTLTPVTLADRPVMLAVLHDLTERKKAEELIKDHAVVLEFQKKELERANAELAALATTDGLTGLKNHRAFQERLSEEVSRAARYGTPLSLILLDVDRFKQYNDTYGHPEGDAVLKAVAFVLEDGARDTDVVARYGGEEFVLVLSQTDMEGAAAVAERLRAAVERYSWPMRAVTASFGVAALRMGEEGGAEMIARADGALYVSKSKGRNCLTCAAVSSLPEEALLKDSPEQTCA